MNLKDKQELLEQNNVQKHEVWTKFPSWSQYRYDGRPDGREAWDVSIVRGRPQRLGKQMGTVQIPGSPFTIYIILNIPTYLSLSFFNCHK